MIARCACKGPLRFVHTAECFILIRGRCEWTFSGPFALSKDEFCEVRYLLVGVLTVPILEKQPQPGENPPSGEADQRIRILELQMHWMQMQKL